MGKCSSNYLKELKPALLMVLVETVYSVVNICYKLAANDGMNLSVLVGYRFIFGAAFILPVAILAERKKRPKLTRKIAFYGFLCGLFGGALCQNLYLKALVLTSATFASAMTNLIPAITFVVAISLRLERLAWNTSAGKAKVLGTMLGIGGAMVLTFYKGMELQPWNTHINLLETTSTHHHPSGLPPPNEHGGLGYVLGAVLSLASCLFYSLWLIVQAKAGEEYPCPYSITAMMAVWASVLGVAFALCVERDWSQWRFGWDIRLFTVALSGVLGSGMMFTLVAWCVRTRGPLFVSIFQPLMLVMVAVGGSLFLEEKLHLGMVIGAILIVSGLYIVLWGKRNEMKAHESLTQHTENEARIDIPPPPQPPRPVVPSSSSNRASRAKEAAKEEEEEDEAPHIQSQNGSSHSNSSGRIELALGHENNNNNDNNNIDSRRSCTTEVDDESQNEISSRSCSSSAAAEQGQVDLPPPLPTQNDGRNSSSSSGGDGTTVAEEMEAKMATEMAALSEATLEAEEVEMQPQLETASGPPPPPPPPLPRRPRPRPRPRRPSS